MGSTQTGTCSSQDKGTKKDKGRRIWTQLEEATLISSVKELIVLGWKSENGFRAGYLHKLEEAMKAAYPTTDLRATPHINSKLSSWKKNYYSLSTILGTSGTGFNDKGTHKIVIEDEAWEQIIKADPNAKQMRYKSWPFYYDWKEIFGKDRATGETAEDMTDAWNELRNEKSGDESFPADFDVSLEDLQENEGVAESVSATQKRAKEAPAVNRKKAKGGGDIAGVCDILIEIGRKTDERLASLADSLGYEARLGKTLEDTFVQLGNIPNLSLEERFEVSSILGTQVDKLKIFKGMPDSARPQFVAWLLKVNRN